VVTWKKVISIGWRQTVEHVYSVGQDKMEHFVSECKEVRKRFRELSSYKEERLARMWSDDLDREKGKVLKSFWKEKERRMKMRKVEDIAQLSNCNKG